MDENTHPPTVYFPLIVHEAIMIEPTETENKQRLDEFVEVMLKIAKEIEENPEEVLIVFGRSFSLGYLRVWSHSVK